MTGRDPCHCKTCERVHRLEAAGWDEFVALVEDGRPRFLPGLKKLMGMMVRWLIGDVYKVDNGFQDVRRPPQ